MATKTFEELKQMAIQIRDEKANKQNTATRIGTQMLEHLNKLEQEYIDKETTTGIFSELDKATNKFVFTNDCKANSFIKEIYLNGWTDEDIYITVLNLDDNSKATINLMSSDGSYITRTYQVDVEPIIELKNEGLASESPINGYICLDTNNWELISKGGALITSMPRIRSIAKSIENCPSIRQFLFEKKQTEKNTNIDNNIVELNENIDSIDRDIKIINWDWQSNIDENVAQAAGNCILGIPVEKEAYLKINFYQLLQGDIKLLICNWDKPSGTINIEEQIPISVNSGINEILIDKKIPAGKYIGLSKFYFNKSQKILGESYIVSSKIAFKGEMMSYTVLSETSEKLLTINQELKENIKKTDENKKNIDENTKNIISLEEKIASITGNEFWVKAYGNTFNRADYVVSNSEVNESSIILNQAGGYVALNKKYWSDRRIHRFVVTPTTLGVLKINMAQDTSNLMFPDMTAAGSFTSEFRIDMSQNKIYIGRQEFDSNLSFIQDRKYIVELKYIRQVFYVTVTDFLTGAKTECVLDTSESLQNGAFKCFLTFVNDSGNYTIEQVETYLVGGCLLVIFGDSVTEVCARVGKGENYSEIIAEKYGSVTIVAQGGAGQSSWDEIFENEIKHIKPKYCSWHMGLNGGFSKEQVEQVISDCISNDIKPIINHVISYIVANREETNFSPALNAIVDEIWAEKGYRGYYGDIATAKNNDINDRTNYSAVNSKTVPGGFDIIKTSASYDAFFTYIIQAGKTVVENGEQRVLDAPLEVIMNIHPRSEGHKLMAERYFLDIEL